jgi:hypothetical protein
VKDLVGASLLFTAQANDRRLLEWSQTPTSISFVADTIDTGRTSLRLDSTGAQTPQVGLPNLLASGGQVGGFMFRFKVQTLPPTTNALFIWMRTSLAAEDIRVRINTTGALTYSRDGGGTYTGLGVTVNVGEVHTIEVMLDCGVSTTHTVKIRVDGVEKVNTTYGANAMTMSAVTNVPLQVQAAQEDVIDVADLVSYNSTGEYGMLGSDWRVYGLTPTGDGTHSFTAGDFQDQASANIATNSTTSYQNVDEQPPSTADFVKQVVSRTAGYLEWTFSSLPTSGTPVLVCLAAAVHPVASNLANLSQFRLNSGGNISTEATIDASVATDTLEYRKHHYPFEPVSGAAWSAAKVNALRVRYGFSTDISPPPALDSVMIFAVLPYTASVSQVLQDSVMVT